MESEYNGLKEEEQINTMKSKKQRERKKIVSDIKKYSTRGEKHMNKGELDKAVSYFTQAYKSSISLRSPVIKQKCALNLGAAYIASHNIESIDKGIEYLRKALPPEDAVIDFPKGDLYFNLALAFEKKGCDDQVLRYFEKAYQAYSNDKTAAENEVNVLRRLVDLTRTDSQSNVQWLKKLSSAYEKMANYEKCISTLLEYLVECDEADNNGNDNQVDGDFCYAALLKHKNNILPSPLAIMYNSLGLFYVRRNDVDKADDCFTRGLKVISQDPSKVRAALNQNSGAVKCYLNKCDEAIGLESCAAEIFAISTETQRNQGHCFLNMGYAYSQLGQIENAKEAFLHALWAARNSRDLNSTVQALENLGSVEEKQKDFENAEGYYKQALNLAPKTKDICSQYSSVYERIYQKLRRVIKQSDTVTKNSSSDSKLKLCDASTFTSSSNKKQSTEEAYASDAEEQTDTEEASASDAEEQRDTEEASASDAEEQTDTEEASASDAEEQTDTEKPPTSDREKTQVKEPASRTRGKCLTKRVSSRQTQDPEGNHVRSQRINRQLLQPDFDEDAKHIKEYEQILREEDRQHNKELSETINETSLKRPPRESELVSVVQVHHPSPPKSDSHYHTAEGSRKPPSVYDDDDDDNDDDSDDDDDDDDDDESDDDDNDDDNDDDDNDDGHSHDDDDDDDNDDTDVDDDDNEYTSEDDTFTSDAASKISNFQYTKKSDKTTTTEQHAQIKNETPESEHQISSNRPPQESQSATAAQVHHPSPPKSDSHSHTAEESSSMKPDITPENICEEQPSLKHKQHHEQDSDHDDNDDHKYMSEDDTHKSDASCKSSNSQHTKKNDKTTTTEHQTQDEIEAASQVETEMSENKPEEQDEDASERNRRMREYHEEKAEKEQTSKESTSQEKESKICIIM